MKTHLTCFSLLLLPAFLLAQQTPTPPQQTREDLLQKSKQQKTTAFILLGAGALATIGGAVMFEDNFTIFGDGNDGDVIASGILMAAGGICMIGSIPLFVASAKNKQKAMDMTAGIKMERLPPVIFSKQATLAYPALSLRISIR